MRPIFIESSDGRSLFATTGIALLYIMPQLTCKQLLHISTPLHIIPHNMLQPPMELPRDLAKTGGGGVKGGGRTRGGGRPRRFWQQEDGTNKDSVVPVLVGLGLFVAMCISLCCWHGRKWLAACRRSRQQTAPLQSQGPILMRR